MRARALDFSFLAACISSPTPLIRIPPFHLIVLNTPLPGYFLNLWRTAKTRICADGGSNRVLGFQGWNGREKLPDCVVGDLDSAAPQALSFFRSKVDFHTKSFFARKKELNFPLLSKLLSSSTRTKTRMTFKNPLRISFKLALKQAISQL
eukprot:c9377_g1_i1.p1 GENE.c9377_g1_i1~~c9377_g1_i1.p1  ORF type:complete len:162 (-),score=33.84 c9377_g1_i1:550-999(-)